MVKNVCLKHFASTAGVSSDIIDLYFKEYMSPAPSLFLFVFMLLWHLGKVVFHLSFSEMKSIWIGCFHGVSYALFVLKIF